MLQEEIRSTPQFRLPLQLNYRFNNKHNDSTQQQPSLLEYWSQPDIQSNVLGRHATCGPFSSIFTRWQTIGFWILDKTIRLWNVETGTADTSTDRTYWSGQFSSIFTRWQTIGFRI